MSDTQVDTSQTSTVETETDYSEITSPTLFFPTESCRRYYCEAEKRRAPGCEIVFLQSAYRQIVGHLKQDTTREYGGILLGYRSLASDGLKPVVQVVCGIPAQHTNGSLSRLTFTEE